MLAVRERDARPAIGAVGELAAVHEQPCGPALVRRDPGLVALKSSTTFGPVTPACVTTGHTRLPFTVDRCTRICVPEMAMSAGEAAPVNGTAWRMCTFSSVTRRAEGPSVIVFCVSSTAMSRTQASLTAAIRSSVYWPGDRYVCAGTAMRIDSKPTCSMRPGNVYLTIAAPAGLRCSASYESDSGTSSVIATARHLTDRAIDVDDGAGLDPHLRLAVAGQDVHLHELNPRLVTGRSIRTASPGLKIAAESTSNVSAPDGT